MPEKIIKEIYNNKYWKWNGFKIAWNVKGEGNIIPIVLIHGFGASSSHWRNNVKFFVKRGFAVYSLDLLGFGKSEQPGIKTINKLDNGIWCDQVTDFIKEIIRPENSNKIILIGNSLGSLVALTCAAYFPEEISGVIASPLPDQINLSPLIKKGRFRCHKLKIKLVKLFFILAPLKIILFLIIKLGFINLGLKAAYFKKNKIDQELINIVKEPALRKHAARSLRAMCIGMSIRTDKLRASYLLNLLNNSQKIPLLLIWGQKDNFIPLFIGKKIAKYYSWVELKIIPNSGHCVHDEDHLLFNKISYQWIKNLNLFKI